MNQIQSQVREFMLASGQVCPEKPTIPDLKTRILRCRLLLEECLEFCRASGVDVYNPRHDESIEMDELEFGESDHKPDLIEISDSLADTNYVSYGAALAYGVDLEPIEQAIHNNNLSKLKDSWVDEHGKLRKGPSYKPVDLEPLIDAQLNDK